MAEILIGSNFSRDGSDYDPSARTPATGEILQALSRHHIRTSDVFTLVLLGILYPGGRPDGMARVTTGQNILRVIQRNGGTQAAIDPGQTIRLAEIFMDMDRPAVHIYGFVIKI